MKKKMNSIKHHLLARVAHEKEVNRARTRRHTKVVMMDVVVDMTTLMYIIVQVSLLVGHVSGAEVKEKEVSQRMNILSCIKWHQALGSQVLIVHTDMGNNMEINFMILRLSMDSRSSMVDTVVLRMGMGNNSME